MPAVRSAGLAQPAPEGTVYAMTPGSRYRVMKPFTDCYGGSFEQGELLTFKERHFLPYHGGHTIVFDERSLYLQEDEHREILGRFQSIWRGSRNPILTSEPMKTRKKIPTFKDEAAEREFWSREDSTQYVDWSRAEAVTLVKLKPRSVRFRYGSPQ